MWKQLACWGISPPFRTVPPHRLPPRGTPWAARRVCSASTVSTHGSCRTISQRPEVHADQTCGREGDARSRRPSASLRVSPPTPGFAFLLGVLQAAQCPRDPPGQHPLPALAGTPLHAEEGQSPPPVRLACSRHSPRAGASPGQTREGHVGFHSPLTGQGGTRGSRALRSTPHPCLMWGQRSHYPEDKSATASAYVPIGPWVL